MVMPIVARLGAFFVTQLAVFVGVELFEHAFPHLLEVGTLGPSALVGICRFFLVAVLRGILLIRVVAERGAGKHRRQE
jgi:hypothetical protein